MFFVWIPQIGIDPPRGVLMYGPPGCGKTMLAKAVAHHTTGQSCPSARCGVRRNATVTVNMSCLCCVCVCAAAFIRVVGSEFVQKYLGEGPRMVRDVFRLAKENAPAIIFIDEIDAIATKRFDAQTGGRRGCDCCVRVCVHEPTPPLTRLLCSRQGGAENLTGAAESNGRLRPERQRQGGSSLSSLSHAIIRHILR